MTISIVGAILAMIEQFLPLLGAGAATTTQIGLIITTLEKILPLVINFVPTFYKTVKNIITALTSDPSTTPDQLAALKEIDAQVDVAFEAAAKDVDPDAPGG